MQPVEERESGCLTIAIDTADIPLFKKKIREFEQLAYFFLNGKLVSEARLKAEIRGGASSYCTLTFQRAETSTAT